MILRPGSSSIRCATSKRACATTRAINSASLAAVADDAKAGNRAALYERLYRRALRSATVSVDLDGDGQADAHRMLSVLNFQRI